MNQELRAGIISAGQGLRFQTTYPKSIKPMIPIKGAPLIAWTVSSLKEAGARQIAVLFNSKGTPARNYLKTHFSDIRWTFLMKDTLSSWESFRIVCRIMARTPGPFLISTVDALAHPNEISQFARSAFQAFNSKVLPRAEMALALTPFIEDEKPLWADISSEGRITAMGNDAKDRKLVTCGLYALTPEAASSLPPTSAHNSLREFWITTARDDRRIFGMTFPQTIDVDRPEDIVTAETFLAARHPLGLATK